MFFAADFVNCIHNFLFIFYCSQQQYTQQAPYRTHRRRMKEIKLLNHTHGLCDVTVRNIVKSMSLIRLSRLDPVAAPGKWPVRHSFSNPNFRLLLCTEMTV